MSFRVPEEQQTRPSRRRHLCAQSGWGGVSSGAINTDPGPSRRTRDTKRVNQLGGHYTTGTPLSRELRAHIIELSRQGLRQSDISRCTKVTHGCVSKLLTRYRETGEVNPAQNVGRPRVITKPIERKIKEYWAADPGIFCWEIRERLLREEVCQSSDLPSLSSIGRVLKESLVRSTVTVGTNAATTAEEESNAASYTCFTIANILGLEKESEGNTKKETRKNIEQSSASSLKKRKRPARRTKFTPFQLCELEREFHENPYPVPKKRCAISKKLDIRSETIRVWFANQRARRRSVEADQDGLLQGNPCTEPSCCSCLDNSYEYSPLLYSYCPYQQNIHYFMS